MLLFLYDNDMRLYYPLYSHIIEGMYDYISPLFNFKGDQ